MHLNGEQQNQSEALFSITGRSGEHKTIVHCCNIKQPLFLEVLSSHALQGSRPAKVRVKRYVACWKTRALEPRAHAVALGSFWVGRASSCVRCCRIIIVLNRLRVLFSITAETRTDFLTLSPECGASVLPIFSFENLLNEYLNW